jgi:hypothetical protein
MTIYFKTVGVTFAVLAMALSVCGQATRAQVKRLPRVGYLRSDQPAGRSHDGCDNHYLYRQKGAVKSIFTSGADGFDAWMNLDGQNVELNLVRTTLSHVDPFEAKARYDYRYKDIRITVSLTHLSDYTVWVPARLVLRRGRAARTLRAFVTPQCD